ncbi:MAG TPA: histidine kinase [Anaerolineales bacterium]|nr:histidine kinase [Anaerolineales bacterium]
MQTVEPRGYRGAYLISHLILIVVAVRGIAQYWEHPNFTPVVLLLGTFALLYLLERIIPDRLRWYPLLYFPVQAGLVWALSSLRPFLDVSNLLYFILSMQVMQVFSRRVAVGWLALYAIMLATSLVLGSSWVEGVVLSLSYFAGIFFVVSYDVLYRQAQSDQAESQVLLAELQQAHQELQEYAAQGEELAAARERNRLARQLHDSVSQVIFGINLTAQSARLFLERDPRQVSELLDRLQEMAASALSQLRSLIAQLRPPQTS